MRVLRRRFASLFVCMVLAAPLWSGAFAPAASQPAVAAPVTGNSQLYLRLSNSDSQLQRFDAGSLTPAGNTSILGLGNPGGYTPGFVLASADGSTVAAISNAPTRPTATESQLRAAITVRVIDVVSGRTRAQFHPEVPVWIEGISPNGDQLFGWRASTDSSQKPEWEVLNASTGMVTDSIAPAIIGCWMSKFDPAAQRLYVLESTCGASADQGSSLPPPVLTAYDLSSGAQVGRLRLDGVVSGSVSPDPGSADMAFKMWNPGFTLSPDGTQIAVLDGQSNRLLLIDSERLRIVSDLHLSKPRGLLERLWESIGLASSTAFAKEWLGTDMSIQFAADGRRLYVTGREGTTGSDGKWTMQGMGLQVVDAATGQVSAEALSGQLVDSIAPGPDGSSIYTVTESAAGGVPYVLRRQDAFNLAVLAQRSFDDIPEIYFARQSSPSAPSWLDAWPMVGHDPQRTNRSSASGPISVREQFEVRGLSAELVGPDGTIYAASRAGLVAVDAEGKKLWRVWDCCVDGAPSLAPNGMILGTGFHTRTLPARQSDTEAMGITPAGKVAWRIQPFGLLKGAAPLVTDSNLLYLPIVGPAGSRAQGLDVMSTDGKMLRQLEKVYSLAMTSDGTIRALVGSEIEAITSDGVLLWKHALKHAASGLVGPMVGQGDVAYVGNGASLLAFNKAGTLLWTYNKKDGALSLAERGDGVILIAGRNSLDAIGTDGRRLWRTDIGPSRGLYGPEHPSLIVDGDGTAYVGSGDGSVLAISSIGEILAGFMGGGPHHHFSPGLLMDAHGRLIVSGTDGVTRVYAPS